MTRSRVVFLAALVSAVALLAPAGAQAAAISGSVTLASEPGDFIGQGGDYLFDSGLTVTGTPSGVSIAAGPFFLEFAPPSGDQLAVGQYDHARRAAFRPPGSPGIDISGQGRGCDDDFGRFEVKDIHVDTAGNVDRLWLLYEQHCDSPANPPLFGEVRIGEPAGTAPLRSEPTAIAWPSMPLDHTARVVPVTLLAGSAGATVTGIAIRGHDASAFGIDTDGCVGHTLAAGDRCRFDATFSPTAQGSFAGRLDITDSTGATTQVPLAGTATAPVLAPTTTAIASSPPASSFGTPVTYDASVTADSGAPTGTIQYGIGGVGDIGPPIPLDSGHANPAMVAILDVGTTVSAAYSGDAKFARSATTVKPAIIPAETAVSLTSDANPQSAGEPFTLIATVQNKSTSIPPFGSVQFIVNGSPVLAPEPLDEGGSAAIVGRVSAGTYQVTAKYHDDTADVADFVDSEGSLTQLVRGSTASANTTPSGLTAPSPSPGFVQPAVPSSSIVLGTPRVAKDGRLLLSAQTRDPGDFRLRATTRSTDLLATKAQAAKHKKKKKKKAKTVVFGTGSASNVGPGQVDLVVTPTRKAKAALARGKALHVTIAVTFQSSRGGSPSTTNVRATVRRARAHGARTARPRLILAAHR